MVSIKNEETGKSCVVYGITPIRFNLFLICSISLQEN